MNQVGSEPAPASQIDIIVYLASLASRPTEIDPMLEPLRLITSKLEPGQAPSAADNQQLAAVQRQLEEYLIHREPVRRFTAESLTLRVQEGLSGKTTQGFAGSVIGWLAFTAFLTALPYLVGFRLNAELKQVTSSVSVLTGLCMAAAWFFITSVRDFKAELRDGYRLIAIGLVIFGIAMLIQPVRTVLGAGDVQWTHFELSITPYLFAHLPIYLGVRKLARQFGLRSVFTSVWLLMGSFAVTGVAVVLAPHVETVAQELFFDLSAIALVWCSVFTVIGLGLMRLVTRAIGSLYRPPMHWLLAGYVAIALASWLYLTIRFVLGFLPQGWPQIVSYIPTLTGGILLFIAAVKFKKTSVH